MKILEHYKDFGYEIIKDIIPQKLVNEVKDFLKSERNKTLESVKHDFNFDSESDLISKAQAFYAKKSEFAKLKKETQMALSGHFSIESRLANTTKKIPSYGDIQKILKEALAAESVRLHMPPTARFILPGNTIAAVPPHQDVAYNKQVSDFIIMWVPFVDIDDECGGVVVHHGTGKLSEIPTESGGFWLKGVQSGSSDLRHCKMSAGDILLMNKFIVHESRGNFSNRTRYSIDFRLFDSRLKSTKHSYDFEKEEVIEPSQN